MLSVGNNCYLLFQKRTANNCGCSIYILTPEITDSTLIKNNQNNVTLNDI
jgi:hypothetical protein